MVIMTVMMDKVEHTLRKSLERIVGLQHKLCCKPCNGSLVCPTSSCSGTFQSYTITNFEVSRTFWFRYLPARASEQGNVIGSVCILYYVCTIFFCN